jgi:hypothetical protein
MRKFVSFVNRKSHIIAPTNGEQLWGNTLELAQTLGDGVGCSRRVSSMAVQTKSKSNPREFMDHQNMAVVNAYRSGAPSVDRS